MKSLLTLEPVGFGRSLARNRRGLPTAAAEPASSRLLSRNELRNCRLRLARFHAPSPAEELGRLRVKLAAIEAQRPTQGDAPALAAYAARKSDCLKYIGELALKNFYK